MVGKKTTCVLKRRVQTQGSGGGWTPSFVRVAEFNAVFQTLSERERIGMDSRLVQSTHILTVSTKALNESNLDELEKPANVVEIASKDYQITGVNLREGAGKHYEVSMRFVE